MPGPTKSSSAPSAAPTPCCCWWPIARRRVWLCVSNSRVDLWVANPPRHGQESALTPSEIGRQPGRQAIVSDLLASALKRLIAALIGLAGRPRRGRRGRRVRRRITVAQANHDDFFSYPTDDYGFQTVDIPAGRQHMDGDTALKYARTRHYKEKIPPHRSPTAVRFRCPGGLLSLTNWLRALLVAAAINRTDPDRPQPARRHANGAAAPSQRRGRDPLHWASIQTLVTPFTARMAGASCSTRNLSSNRCRALFSGVAWTALPASRNPDAPAVAGPGRPHGRPPDPERLYHHEQPATRA